MLAQEIDVDEVQAYWKIWKKHEVAHQWKIFYDCEWRAEGTGFDDFRQTLIHVHEGVHGGETDEQEPQHAHPCLGFYMFSKPDRPERIKILGVAYCDDQKKHMLGAGMKGRKKVMAFPYTKQAAQDSWFEGVKGPKLLQWSSEADLTEEALLAWFDEGDRL